MPPKGHTIPIEKRLLKRRDIADNGCWNWTGAIVHGYGHIGITTEEGLKHRKVHRVSYEHFVGPIPAGLTIDHLCRNTRCFNPDHLEPVTMAVNIHRGTSPSAKNKSKTHCPNGHEYTAANTYRPPNGQRVCRVCRADRQRRLTELRRSKATPKPRPKKTLEERIESLIERRSGHWLWVGYVARTGPVMSVDGTKLLVKRWAAEQAGLEVSRSTAIRSTCGEDLCVNPVHMKAVSRSSIIAAAKMRDTCVKGHSMMGDNLYFDTKGYRACRQCQRDSATPACRTCGQPWLPELTVRAADGRRQCTHCRPPKK